MNVGRVHSRNIISTPRLGVQAMNPQGLPPDRARRAELDGVLVVDSHGAIRYCSAELAGHVGQPAAGLLGRPARSLLPGLPPDPRTLIGKHARLLQLALADGTSVPAEIVCEAFQVAHEALIAVCGDFNAEERQSPLRTIRADPEDTGSPDLAGRSIRTSCCGRSWWSRWCRRS